MINTQAALTILLLSLSSQGCHCLKAADQEKKLKLIAVGDIVHAHNWPEDFISVRRSLNAPATDVYERLGKKMFAPTRPLIQTADLAFANLETPFTTRKIKRKPFFQFSSHPKDLDYTIWAGFNLFSLANNHTADAGREGIKSTLELMLAKKKIHKNIHWAGIGLKKDDWRKPTIIRLPEKNITVAFYAYSKLWQRYTNLYKERVVIEDLKKAPKVDLVILSLHNSVEFRHVPFKYTVRRYRKFIDHGADIILGHHPHVGQGIERYKDGVIFYSLGDFSFGPAHKRYFRRAQMFNMIAEIDIVKGQTTSIKSVRAHPLYTDFFRELKVGGKTLGPSKFIPQLLEPPFSTHIMKTIIKWSEKIPGNKTRFKLNQRTLEVLPAATSTEKT